jgi:hypothetical protein
LRRHQHQHVPSEPRLRGAPTPLCTRETTPLRASDFAGRRQRDAGPSCGSCRGPVSRLADPSRTTAGMPCQPLLLTGLRSLASAPAASACPAPAAALLAGLRSSASASASGGCPVPPPLLLTSLSSPAFVPAAGRLALGRGRRYAGWVFRVIGGRHDGEEDWYGRGACGSRLVGLDRLVGCWVCGCRIGFYT